MTRAVVAMALPAAIAVAAPLTGLRYHSVTLVDPLLIVAAVALGVEAVIRGRRPHALPPTVGAGIALIMAGGVLGTLFASNAVPSITNLARFILSLVGPLLLVFAWEPDADAVRRFSSLWVAAATASAAVGLVSAGGAGGRARGLTTHPNELAIVSVLGASLALSYALSEERRTRWAAVAACVVLCLAVLRSGSRAGLIALVVGALVVVVQVRSRAAPSLDGAAWRRRQLVVLGGGVLVALGLLYVGRVSLGPHNAGRRLLGDVTATASDAGRSRLLAEGLRTFAAHPLTGTGFQNALQAHNIYVQVAAASGILGLTGLALILSSVVRNGLAGGSRQHAWLSTGYVAGFLGYLAAGLFQNMLWDRYLWLHAAAILWLGSSHHRDRISADQCA